MVALVVDAMWCTSYILSQNSYSVFLFLNVFYAEKILLSCYKDKFADNNIEKLTFRLT